MRLVSEELLDLLKANHEVCPTITIDIVNFPIVGRLVLAGKLFTTSVEDVSVELLKRTFLGIIVFLTDKLSTKFESCNRSTIHGA